MAIDPRLLQAPGKVPQIYARVSDLDRRVRQLEAARSVIGAGTITGGTNGMVASGTITAGQIAAGSITSALIQAGAIQAGHIDAGAITSLHIAAGTITASDIQAGTITATQIAASTITAANIAAHAITANEIAASTITTTELAANTITANDIAAGAITTTELAANTITAADIAAGTITATQIAAATITGSLIASATITGTNIISGAITATHISVSNLAAISADLGSITAGTITGGTIQSATSGARWVGNTVGITGFNAAGDVTFAFDNSTGKITTIAGMGGGNLLSDSSFEQADAATRWTSSTGVTGIARVTTQQKHGVASLQFGNSLTTITFCRLRLNDSGPKAKPSTNYTYTLWIRNTVASRRARLAMLFRDASNATIGSQVNGTFMDLPSDGSWVRLPALTVSTALSTLDHLMPMVEVHTLSGNFPTLDTFQIDAVQIEEGSIATAFGPRPDEILVDQVTSAELQDNIFSSEAVVDSHFAAGVLHADRMVANSITATQIAASTITATQIAANTITAGNIAAGTITATQIATGTITATQIASATITATQMNVTTLSSITGNVGTLTTGVLEGPTLRTGPTSAARVSLEAATGLRAFADATTETFRVNQADGTVSQRAYITTLLSGTTIFADADTHTFELDVGDWVGFNAGTIARSTAQFKAGVASGLVTVGGASRGAEAATNGTYTFLSGRTYQATIWVRGVDANMTSIGVWWGDITNGDFVTLSKQSYAVGAWRQYKLEWTPTANRTAVKIRVLNVALVTGAASSTFHVDELRVVDITPDSTNAYALRESVPGGALVGRLTSARWDNNAIVRVQAQSAIAAQTEITEARLDTLLNTGAVSSSIIARTGPVMSPSGAHTAVWVGINGVSGYQEKLLLDGGAHGNSDWLQETGEHVSVSRVTTTWGLTNGTWTSIRFDVKDYDVSTSGQRHWTSGAFGAQLVAVKTGVHMITGTFSIAGNATGLHRLGRIVKNGTTTLAQSGVTSSALGTGAPRICVTAFAYLVAGDAVTLDGYQDSGGTLNVDPTAGEPARFSMSRVGNLNE